MQIKLIHNWMRDIWKIKIDGKYVVCFSSRNNAHKYYDFIVREYLKTGKMCPVQWKE